MRRSWVRSPLWPPAPYWLGRCQYDAAGLDRGHGLPALSHVWQPVKLSDVSLGTRPRYCLVVDEDGKKPNNQKNYLNSLILTGQCFLLEILNKTQTIWEYLCFFSSCDPFGEFIDDHLLPRFSSICSHEGVWHFGCSPRRCAFQALDICEPLSSPIPLAINSSNQKRSLEIVSPTNMSGEGHLLFTYSFRQSFLYICLLLMVFSSRFSTPPHSKTFSFVALYDHAFRKVFLSTTSHLCLLSFEKSKKNCRCFYLSKKWTKEREKEDRRKQKKQKTFMNQLLSVS